jgi:hypothetical protein
MTLRTSILVVALTVPASIVARAQSVDNTPAPVVAPAGAQPSYSADSAVIEEIIEAVDDGYRFNAYVVRWHGVRVLVSDPAGQGHLAVGDTLHFIAATFEVISGQRMLNFISTEHDAGSSNHPGPGAEPSTVKSETSTVEEVLQAQENGYRFTGYVVRWRGRRVAVIDMQSSPPHAVGDPLDLVVMRMSPMGRQLLGFAEPSKLEPAAVRSTPDMGIVEEVLSGRVDDDVYAEYIVRWHGSRVAVSAGTPGPSSGGTSPSIGAGIPLTITHAKLPSSGGVLNFAAATPVDMAAMEQSASHSSIVVSNAKGTVEQVLTAKADDYAYRAYIVLWQGNRVAVSDAFASTHLLAGDQVTFSVARVGSPGSGQLQFTLFDFPCAQAAKACTPPIATTR